MGGGDLLFFSSFRSALSWQPAVKNSLSLSLFLSLSLALALSLSFFFLNSFREGAYYPQREFMFFYSR